MVLRKWANVSGKPTRKGFMDIIGNIIYRKFHVCSSYEVKKKEL